MANTKQVAPRTVVKRRKASGVYLPANAPAGTIPFPEKLARLNAMLEKAIKCRLPFFFAKTSRD